MHTSVVGDTSKNVATVQMNFNSTGKKGLEVLSFDLLSYKTLGEYRSNNSFDYINCETSKNKLNARAMFFYCLIDGILFIKKLKPIKISRRSPCVLNETYSNS